MNQTVNSATLTREDVDRETAIAYSAGQQLITTAWNVGLAVVLVTVVFGWWQRLGLPTSDRTEGSSPALVGAAESRHRRSPHRRRHL